MFYKCFHTGEAARIGKMRFIENNVSVPQKAEMVSPISMSMMDHKYTDEKFITV